MIRPGFPPQPTNKISDANGRRFLSPRLIKAQGSKPGESYFFYFTGIINCKYVPQKQIT
jgi:hypothetical protein